LVNDFRPDIDRIRDRTWVDWREWPIGFGLGGLVRIIETLKRNLL
jgi:hypothetical protein